MKKKLESMQQKHEELVCEVKELKERISTEEFVALEKEATKEQEVRKPISLVQFWSRDTFSR